MKGQTLVELVVALALVGIVISAITISVIKSLSAAQLNKNKNLATQYVQEGMETMRNFKDRDFSNYKDESGKYCLGDDGTLVSVSSCTTTNVASLFTREVEIIKTTTPECGDKADKVTVKISWNDNGCTGTTKCQTTEQVSCLSNLYSTGEAPAAPPPPTDCSVCGLVSAPVRACLGNPCRFNATNPICQSEIRTCGTNANCYGHICTSDTM